MKIKKFNEFVNEQDKYLTKDEFVSLFIQMHSFIEPDESIIKKEYDKYYDKFYKMNKSNETIMDLIKDDILSQDMLEVEE